MKARKLAVFMIMGILIMTLPNSCKKSDDEPSVPSPGPVIPETTKVIPDSVWNDYIVSIDSSDWTLEFDPTLSEQYGIEDGDIIISTLGEGLLRKVTHISEEGGTLIIYTQEGTIVEAMPKGNVKFNIDLTEQLKNAKPSYIAEGVKMAPNQRNGQEVMELVFSLEQELHENVTIAGVLSFTSSMSGTVAWNGTTPDTLILELNMVENLEITSTIDISSLELKKEITLVTVPLPPITIYAVIPIVIKPVLSLKLGANLEIHSEVSSGVYQELDFTTGFEYINGDITPFCNMEKDLGPIPPELTNTLAAKAFVKPQIDMKIYGVISPNFSMQMYALLEAELGETPWWILYAGLSGEAGFNVGIWGFTILNIKVNLFDYKVPVANADTPINTDPEACFTVDPTNGAVGTEFLFDASCCQDAEDPLEDLLVRWDWNGDGNWDTDFSTDKQQSHIYTDEAIYTVAMEVKDTGGETDETSTNVYVSNFGTGSPCPGIETIEYDGQVYNTVSIGNQCWLKENLNIGEMIPGSGYPEDNGIIEKFCYDDDPANCDKYGGLYLWEEMMSYDEGGDFHGICPPGWHIPTDEEWKVMEGIIDSQYGVGDPEWEGTGDRGYDAGSNMKTTTGWLYNNNGTNTSGFTGLPAGIWSNHIFCHIEYNGVWWTSTPNSTRTKAWKRSPIGAKSSRSLNYVNTGFSVRCIMD